MDKQKIVIVGAGPVGMMAALCLAKNEIPCVILDKKKSIGEGSRAICFARHNLALFDKVGLYKNISKFGVPWSVSNIYLGNQLILSEKLNQDASSTYPAYLNIQQNYLEYELQELVKRNSLIELRLDNEVIDVQITNDMGMLTIKNKKEIYTIYPDYIIASDGVKSTVRTMLNCKFSGERFHDKFLIIDIIRENDNPAERTFWFDAPFNNNKTALLLKQPKNMWRLDFQLGGDAVDDYCLSDSFINDRISPVLDENETYQISWKSIYTFKCRRMKNFIYKNIFFIGDAAHEVSPFGARGANGGFQDAENLTNKLCRYIKYGDERKILNDFDVERVAAADENIKQSKRSTRFISPKNPNERDLRNTVLKLAVNDNVFKKMINSGRLSVPENEDLPSKCYDDLYESLANLCSSLSRKELMNFLNHLSYNKYRQPESKTIGELYE